MGEAFKCRACGGRVSSGHLNAKEMMFGRGESFTYDDCGECSSLSLRDIPEDLSQYYPADYYSIDIDPEEALGGPGVRQLVRVLTRSVLLGRGRLAAIALKVMKRRQLHTFVSLMNSVSLTGAVQGPHTSVLDVGCGSGVLVYALGLSGMTSSVGVDPFAPTERDFDCGARLLRRELADVDGLFDLVMFHHSLEHVPDPSASLADAARRLKTGGRVLVRVPTVSSLAYQEYGKDWVQFDAPRHITLFSVPGMERLAANNGFRIVAIRYDSTAFQFWGSEQVRAGVPLMAPTSRLVSERNSMFTQKQINEWDEQSRMLNATNRGDQAVWVLERD